MQAARTLDEKLSRVSGVDFVINVWGLQLNASKSKPRESEASNLVELRNVPAKGSCKQPRPQEVINILAFRSTPNPKEGVTKVSRSPHRSHAGSMPKHPRSMKQQYHSLNAFRNMPNLKEGVTKVSRSPSRSHAWEHAQISPGQQLIK